MLPVSLSIDLARTGPASTVLAGRVGMLGKHRTFSRAVVQTFADAIEASAPRDTGHMISRMTVVRQVRGAGSVEGYGAGAYSLIGDPSNKATPGTIASFISNYPKLRGRPPIASQGAWWTLEQAGKEKLRAMRRFGHYGGSKPAYWYAIAAGLVPSATGGTLLSNDFVTPAIREADQFRRVAAAWVFGGVFGGFSLEGGSWVFV